MSYGTWKLNLVRNLADCFMAQPYNLPLELAYKIAFEHYNREGSKAQTNETQNGHT